jgi:hypothetical protein
MSFKVGDIVKAARTIEVGSISIRINSQGVVRAIEKGFTRKYKVEWPNITLTVKPELIAPTGMKAKN